MKKVMLVVLFFSLVGLVFILASQFVRGDTLPGLGTFTSVLSLTVLFLLKEDKKDKAKEPEKDNATL